jgi:hypothetical protein
VPRQIGERECVLILCRITPNTATTVPPDHLPAAEMGRLSAELSLASVPARSGAVQPCGEPGLNSA